MTGANTSGTFSYLIYVRQVFPLNHRTNNLITTCPTESLQYEPRTVLGKPPYMRGYHASVLADSRLWVFGGFNGTNYFDDVYILDLAGAAYLPQVTSFTINGA